MNIGRLIRKVRIDQGLTVRDLADDKISIGTISRIENGGNAGRKRIKILMDKLGLTTKKLHELDREDKIYQKELYFTLLAIESNIDNGVPDKDIKRALDNIKTTPIDPLHTTTNYLKGKLAMRRKCLSKAREHFLDSLNDRCPEENNYLNIAPASCNELSKIAYYENDLQRAIEHVDQGLKCFRDGKRQYIKGNLMINKALYKEKLGYHADAERILDELLHPSYKIADKAYNYILYHQIKADVEIAKGKPVEAMNYIEKGLELSRINKVYDLQFSLWMALGDVCFELDMVDSSLRCFEQSLKLETKVREQLLISAHRKLSKIYMRMEQWDQAREHIDQSIEMARQHNDGLRHIDSLLTKAQWYRLQELHSEEKMQYKEALKLSKKYKLKKREKIIKNMIGGTDLCLKAEMASQANY